MTEGLTDLPGDALFKIEREDLDRKRVQLMRAAPRTSGACARSRSKSSQSYQTPAETSSRTNQRSILSRPAQRTSAAIEAVMTAAQKTQQQIQLFKELFRSDPEHTTLLDRCVPDFRPAGCTADHSPDNQTAVPALNRQVVPEVHTCVSFSLFMRHKLMFSTFLVVRTRAVENSVPPAAIVAQHWSTATGNASSWLPADA
jgi:hypothetical protein